MSFKGSKNRINSEKMKLLWKNPEYRKHMIEVHKGYMPKNLKQLIERAKKNPTIYWLGKKFSEEHRKKISDGRKGEKHWNWKKDRTKIVQYWTERNNPEYKQWRKNVLKRDNYKCKINNENCNGKIIVHHILPWYDFPELRYNINNGITLCQAHHPRKRAEEKRLIPFFQGLVSVSN